MKIELFYTPGCRKCAGSRDKLKAAAHAENPVVEWRELNVLDNLDYAVELGMLTVPAIAIDGSLTFATLPTEHQLRDAMARTPAPARQ